jgi:type VI secretion system protein
VGSTGLIGRMYHVPPSVPSAESAIDGVMDHLKLLLNTRRGGVPHLPEYGLPDISEVFQSFPESIEMLRRAIQATIEKYEPRLAGVAVRLMETGDTEAKIFRVTFQVTGTIVDEDRRTPVRFNTTVTDTGRARVE